MLFLAGCGSRNGSFYEGLRARDPELLREGMCPEAAQDLTSDSDLLAELDRSLAKLSSGDLIDVGGRRRGEDDLAVFELVFREGGERRSVWVELPLSGSLPCPEEPWFGPRR
jgi:hypothetical protein